MDVQMTLLSTLDDVLDYFHKVERERNEALTRLEALERDISILRSLLPEACANPATGKLKAIRSAGELVGVDPDGLYNNGYRDRVLRWLTTQLAQESDPQLRRWVAVALGVAGDTRSIPVLAAALSDLDPGVRREAAAALGRIGTARVVGPLARTLVEPDNGVRKEVVRALGRTGKPAIRVLVSGLRDQNALVRRGSSDALARIGVPAIAPLAMCLLEDDDRRARIGAVETLGRTRSERAVAPLIVALMEPDTDVQDAAAQALVRTGRPAIDPLVRMLRMASHPLRCRAAGVLVRMRGLAVEPLIEALTSSAEVRATASESLVRIGGPSVQPLIRALNDPNFTVRREAATALGLIGASKAVAPLVSTMRTKDLQTRRTAVEALVRIGRPACAPLASLLKDTDAGLRREAAWALVQIGHPAFSTLCQALQDADFGARWEVAQILSTLRSDGRLRGLHGEWERAVDDTLLMAWFNSGQARDKTCGVEPASDSTQSGGPNLLTQCWPMRQRNKAGHIRRMP